MGGEFHPLCLPMPVLWPRCNSAAIFTAYTCKEGPKKVPSKNR